MNSIVFYVGAAIAEIAGCFAFWAWLRLEKSPLWVVPGILSLIVFAFLLTRIDSTYAGRTYAAYGGVYIAISLAWLWVFEGQQPDRWDLLGSGICLVGGFIYTLGTKSCINKYPLFDNEPCVIFSQFYILQAFPRRRE